MDYFPLPSPLKILASLTEAEQLAGEEDLIGHVKLLEQLPVTDVPPREVPEPLGMVDPGLLI